MTPLTGPDRFLDSTRPPLLMFGSRTLGGLLIPDPTADQGAEPMVVVGLHLHGPDTPEDVPVDHVKDGPDPAMPGCQLVNVALTHDDIMHLAHTLAMAHATADYLDQHRDGDGDAEDMAAHIREVMLGWDDNPTVHPTPHPTGPPRPRTEQ